MTYDQYRSYGHTKWTSLVLSSGYWPLVIAIVIGLVVGSFI